MPSPCLFLPLLILLATVHAWERAQAITVEGTTLVGQQIYMGGDYTKNPDYERVLVTSIQSRSRMVEVEGEEEEEEETYSELVVDIYEYDKYNNFNLLSSFDILENPTCTYAPGDVFYTKNGSENIKKYFVTACGRDIYYIDLDNFNSDGVKSMLWKNESKGEVSSNPNFDLVVTNINHDKMVIIKEDEYYLMPSNIEEINVALFTKLEDNITTSCVSDQYFVLGKKESFCVYNFVNEEINCQNSDNYSLSCFEDNVYVSHINYDPQYISTDLYVYGPDEEGQVVYLREMADYIQTNIDSFQEQDDILSCRHVFEESVSSDSNLKVTVTMSSSADKYSLILTLPICKVADDGDSNCEMNIQSFKNIYYDLRTRNDESDCEYTTETIGGFDYQISTDRTREETFGVLSQMSNEVYVINGINKFCDEGENGSSSFNVIMGNPVLVRTCNRLTCNYPDCVPRSFTKKFEEGEVFRSCPIQFDGYYCDMCAPRFAESAPGDGTGPECDRCAGPYFGPRCSASVAGVVLLSVVFLALMIGSTTGYIVNRK